MKNGLLTSVSLLGLLAWGGPAQAGDVIIGDASAGAFNNTGGPHDITGNLILGNQAAGVGTYTITGATARTSIGFVPGGNGAAKPPGSNGILLDNNFNVLGNNPNANGALIVGEAGTGTFTQGLTNKSDPGNAVSAAGDLVLGHQAGSQGTYTLNTGSLTVGGKMVVGGMSKNNNQFTQNGGSVATTLGGVGNPDYVGVGNALSFNSVQIGGGGRDLDNGTGTYTLHGGSLTTSVLDVGHSGVGTFNQTGGTVNASYLLWLGTCGSCNGGNAVGTYNMSGGTINAGGDEAVALFGIGHFNQSGGIHTIAGTLDIANGTVLPPGPPGTPPREGSYALSGGILTAANITVGDGGNGTFTHTGGLVTVGSGYGGQILAGGSTVPGAPNGPGAIGTLTVSSRNASQGTYAQGATGQTNTAPWGGYPGGSPGVAPPAFNNATNAPYLQVFGNATIGRDDMSSGTFALAGDGSRLQINSVAGSSNQGSLVVGLNGTGAFTQTDNTSVHLDGGLAIGLNTGSQGTYTLSQGSVAVGGDLNVGGSSGVGQPTSQTTARAGTGQFNHFGGTVTVQGNLNVATNPGAVGTYGMLGGSLTVNNAGYIANNGGNGAFEIVDGTAQFGTPAHSGGLLVGTTPAGGPATTGALQILGSTAAVNVYGNAVLGAAANTTANVTMIGGTMNVRATGAGDGNLTVGDAGTSYLNMTGGTVSVANVLSVGVNGIGAIVQNGGDVTAGFLDISTPVGTGTGSYRQINGTLTVANALNVGSGTSGTALFAQNGTVTAGTLFVSNTNAVSPGSSTYDAGFGTLEVFHGIHIGDAVNGSGAATFIHEAGATVLSDGVMTIANAVGGAAASYQISGGILTAASDVVIGSTAGSAGTFSSLGGRVTVGGYTFVGASGTGTVLNDNGRYATQVLVLGQAAGSNGTFTSRNGGHLTVGTIASPGFLDIGESGTGQFTQSGTASAATVNGALDLGRHTGGSGTLTLQAGQFAVNGFGVIGDNGTGLLTQTGGAMAINGPLDIGRGNGGSGATTGGNGTYAISAGSLTVTGPLVLGTAAGNTGAFKQTGGTVTATHGETIGASGTGTWSQSAGTHSVTTDLVLGANVGGSGSMAMNGGSLSVSGGLTVGGAGSGTYSQSAGSAQVGGSVKFKAGGTGSGISGGTLTAGAIVNNAALAFNGGTVNAPVTNNGTIQTTAGHAMTLNGAATNAGTWTVSGGSTFNQSGGFTNNAGATVRVTGSTANFYGGMLDNGAFVSNGSVNTFDHLTVGPAGSVHAGAGDLFRIGGAGGFVNNSMDSLNWSTSGAILEFNGSGLQTLGLSNGAAFAWSELTLDAGVTLNLMRGANSSDNSFYANMLSGLVFSGTTVINIDGNGFNIYYNGASDPALGGLTYNLTHGGQLICIPGTGCGSSGGGGGGGGGGNPVPEPGTLAMLLVGLAGLGVTRRRAGLRPDAHRPSIPAT